MKWEKVEFGEHLAFQLQSGAWKDTPLGEIRIGMTTGCVIRADVPSKGTFVLTPDALYKGLTALIPELEEPGKGTEGD